MPKRYEYRYLKVESTDRSTTMTGPPDPTPIREMTERFEAEINELGQAGWLATTCDYHYKVIRALMVREIEGQASV